MRIVETHITSIYSKLGLKRRSELINYCPGLLKILFLNNTLNIISSPLLHTFGYFLEVLRVYHDAPTVKIYYTYIQNMV
ncbi:MAG: hypothetical protein CVV44_08660 [Spirochaetae bacterium HGW-Spirochaetae-1]|jgi:hypothetical protein|nr:MAG: hypothetical protein CVV44_08660 [Spirochaetae bacterium HGW-Spirochaetae-1]